MKSVLLVAAAPVAAILFTPGPASAQAFSGDSHFGRSMTAVPGRDMDRRGFHGNFGRGFVCDGREGRDGRHRDGRDGHRRGSAGCDFAGLPWGYYDQDINRSWDSDSFNDWWHDRPDRAFPRWVSRNENCTEDRMWWSGSGWHC